MKKIISEQNKTINESINWINDSLKNEKKKNAYYSVVDIRRRLKRIDYALNENPAAAIYGESQVGKSYLVSNLLSMPGETLRVIDGKNNQFDFIREINDSDGRESTSLVTRFSANYKAENVDYPIKIRLLTLVDIILVLCDSYYFDVKNQHYLDTQNINARLKDLFDEIQDEEISQTYIIEDDVLNIQDYFKKYFNDKAREILASDFFEVVSQHISRIRLERWADIFALLWNNNEYLTRLLKIFIIEYNKLDFTNSVNVSFDAVKKDKVSLLSVKTLKSLNREEQDKCDVFYKSKTNQISKALLCAMGAEIIFMLPSNILDSKPFLKTTDLLDFPGARARLENNETDIKDDHIPDMLLRGKVAYLFNKYSDAFMINSLLLCHYDVQSGQRIIPEIIANWINQCVGRTKHDREELIKEAKLPPLFVIGTMFNKDLHFDTINDKKGNKFRLQERWKTRFGVIADEIFGTTTYNWFKNWTTSEANFKNIYLLRDFLYSDEGESAVYRGYKEHGEEKELVEHKGYPGFMNDLKKSFINDPFVKEHFHNADISWDEAASMNKDGSELILKNLGIVADNINKARNLRFSTEIDSLNGKLLEELKKHYHSAEADKRILEAKQKATSIISSMQIAFGRDNYFFGTLMKSFMINEGVIYKLFNEKLRNIAILDKTKVNEYLIIRNKANKIDSNVDFETNLEILKQAYEFDSTENCKKNFVDKGIDLNELFYGSKHIMRSFSQQLADELQSFWFDKYLTHDKLNGISTVLSKSDYDDIIEVLKALYEKLDIRSRISDSIHYYVDGYATIDEVLEMIADIGAEHINRFFGSFGVDFLEKAELAELSEANNKNKLGLVLPINEPSLCKTKEDIGDLLDIIDNLYSLTANNRPDVLDNLPNYKSFKNWSDFLKIGFVSVCNIPTYDIQANKRLGEIIEKFDNKLVQS